MAMPAGYESDEDDLYDDFVFGDSYLDGNDNRNAGTYSSITRQNINNAQNEPNVETNGNPTHSERQGFGLPAGYKTHGSRGFGAPRGSKYPARGKQKAGRGHSSYPHVKQTTSDAAPLRLEDFKSAVCRGNLAEIEKFIDAGIAVDEVLRTGWTALMYGSSYGNEEAVKLLLSHGANPNYNVDEYTPLMATCSSTSGDEMKMVACAKLLIDHGADVNHFDRYHMSPLLYAARENKPRLIKLLIENGANKNKHDNRGYTALSWAASKGHLRAVQVLLEEGADPLVACGDGSTTADIALSSGHNAVASLLTSYTKGDKREAVSRLSSLAAANQQENSGDEQETIAPTSYGPLEMFLVAADLGNLIPTFSQNQVTFEEFLRFTDSDLQKMGITQLGVRKRLLDSIHMTHKKEWLPSSLPSHQYNKIITCSESIALVANLAKHTAYMSSSIGYLTDQIKAHQEVLSSSLESASVFDLRDKTDEALGKTRVLYNELAALRMKLAEEMSQEDFRAPDIIEGPLHAKKGLQYAHRGGLALSTLGVLSVIGLVLWRRGSLPIRSVFTWAAEQLKSLGVVRGWELKQ